MGRWGRSPASELVSWLRIPPNSNWLEIGCGTGALTSAICANGSPRSVVACDTAADFVTYSREHLHFPGLTFAIATTNKLPILPQGYDVVVSSLVLTFLPDPVVALRKMKETCAPSGCLAACVWDYSRGMEFLRTFWTPRSLCAPEAEALHEGLRFPLCQPSALRAAAFEAAGLALVEVTSLEIATPFASFEDYWAPFVNGPGPAPAYVHPSRTLTGTTGRAAAGATLRNDRPTGRLTSAGLDCQRLAGSRLSFPAIRQRPISR